MDIIQQIIQPVLQAKDADILRQDGGLGSAADIAFLCVVNHFIFPVTVHPVAGTPGHKESCKAGGDDDQQEHKVQIGQDGQVDQKAADIHQKVRQALPDVLRCTAVAVAAAMSLFPQLDIICIQRVGEGCGVRFFRNHSNDGRTNIDPGIIHASLKVSLDAQRQEQCRCKEENRQKQLSQ